MFEIKTLKECSLRSHVPQYLSPFDMDCCSWACLNDSFSALEILPVTERGELLLAQKALMQMCPGLTTPCLLASARLLVQYPCIRQYDGDVRFAQRSKAGTQMMICRMRKKGIGIRNSSINPMESWFEHLLLSQDAGLPSRVTLRICTIQVWSQSVNLLSSLL